MKYPSTKPSSHPTPSDKLEVCDRCQEAVWTTRSVGLISYCHCGARKREGTREEYREANLFLIRSIGTRISKI